MGEKNVLMKIKILIFKWNKNHYRKIIEGSW
jgi:hypothetical protein